MNQRNTNKRSNKNKKQITRKNYGGLLDQYQKKTLEDILYDYKGLNQTDFESKFKQYIENMKDSIKTSEDIDEIKQLSSNFYNKKEPSENKSTLVDNILSNILENRKETRQSQPDAAATVPSTQTPVATILPTTAIEEVPSPTETVPSTQTPVATILPTTAIEEVPSPTSTVPSSAIPGTTTPIPRPTKSPLLLIPRKTVDNTLEKIKAEKAAAEEAILPSSTAKAIVPAATSTIVPTASTVPIITSPQDVEDILKELHITMDVKVTGGNPSVIVTMTDTNVWSNTTQTNQTNQTNQTKIIEYKQSKKLNKIIEELKASSDDANGIMSYLNTKKKIFDIKNASDKIQENSNKKQEMIDNLITQLQTFNPKISKLEINNQTIDELKKIIDQYIYDITNQLLQNQPVQSSTSSIITQSQQVATLPEGWESKIDPDTGATYYQNHVTQTTQWEPPKNGGSKNLKQTVQNVQNLVNTKLGGKNLVIAQLKQIRNESK